MIPWWCQAYPECWTMMVERWFKEEFLKMHRDAETIVCRCKVQHTIKAAAASPDTNKHGYANSFIYCDA